MTHQHQDRLALLALVVGAVGIAFAPVLAKQAVVLDGKVGGEILSPAVVGFWRMKWEWYVNVIDLLIAWATFIEVCHV